MTTWRSLTIHMCGMIHSYAWHDAFICVAWLIYMCEWRRYFGVKELVAVFSRIDEDLTLLTAMLTNVSSALAPVIEVPLFAHFVALFRARTLSLSFTSCVSLTLSLSQSLPHSFLWWNLEILISGSRTRNFREQTLGFNHSATGARYQIPGCPWTDAWF